jgi:hypothetical protein
MMSKQDWATLLLSRLTGPSMAVLAILSYKDMKDYDSQNKGVIILWNH